MKLPANFNKISQKKRHPEKVELTALTPRPSIEPLHGAQAIAEKLIKKQAFDLQGREIQDLSPSNFEAHRW